ncbi:MAG: polyamine ABC transporter substrate-binding protein [Steroidobacteraceae bacterium]|jgi:putrescine transport system substrate-binding protein|nr:polyamine ABC transporter substrate-binding protein [Steroidobacteraceae bacterium]
MTTSFHTFALSVAAALLLAACGGKPPPPGGADAPAPGGVAGAAATVEEPVLNVYNWSDYIERSVLEGFTRETGIKINYDMFDSNEVLETKLLTGGTGYDLVVPSGSYLQRQIQAKVYRKLDKSLLPNLVNLDPEFTRRVALYDPGNEYAVNYFWGSTGIGYNAAKIRQRMPDAPLDSFAMFYDPAVASRFADCGITMVDAPPEVLGTVLIHLGKDPNSERPEDLAAAEKVLLAIRPYVRYVNSAKYIEDLVNGEVCLSLGWSGDILQARDRAQEAGKGVDIRYAVPSGGTVQFFDMMAIPADAKHPRNAHLFIDYLLRPEVAAKNSSFVKYANSNAASWPLLEEAIRDSIFPPAAVQQRLVPDVTESPQFTRLLNRAWTRFKLGR